MKLFVWKLRFCTVLFGEGERMGGVSLLPCSPPPPLFFKKKKLGNLERKMLINSCIVKGGRIKILLGNSGQLLIDGIRDTFLRKSSLNSCPLLVNVASTLRPQNGTDADKWDWCRHQLNMPSLGSRTGGRLNILKGGGGGGWAALWTTGAAADRSADCRQPDSPCPATKKATWQNMHKQ